MSGASPDPAARPPLWSSEALQRATGGAASVPFHAEGVSIDTRSLRPGDLFVALVGHNGDGHDHVGEALRRGACGCLVHREDGLPDGAPALVVGDTLAGLRALGEAGRERFTGSVVAVTGSVGKTTTKEMLRLVLGTHGRTHAADASHNNHWGVPLTLSRLPEDDAFCVVEIGMNNPGEIAPLSRLAGPDVAVVTTVGSAHLGHLGSLEAIADEKASVVEGLLAGGVAVLPADTPYAGRLLRAASGRRVETFGDGGDSRLVSVEGDATGSDVEALVGGTSVRFRLGAPGRHMAHDALAALVAAHALGLDTRRCAAALSGFRPAPGRGALRAILGGRAALLDESYNASAASVRASLSLLGLVARGRRVAVLGDMLELGGHAPAEHAGLAEAAAANADLVFSCGPMMRHLFDALPPALRAAHAADAEALAPLVASALLAGDTVLVKGSLGSRMRRVVQALEALGDAAPAADRAADAP